MRVHSAAALGCPGKKEGDGKAEGVGAADILGDDVAADVAESEGLEAVESEGAGVALLV